MSAPSRRVLTPRAEPNRARRKRRKGKSELVAITEELERSVNRWEKRRRAADRTLRRCVQLENEVAM